MADRPFVVLSAAMSADGYIDDASPSRLILSDAADLDRVDELRAGSDAILVGAQTIRADNPRLVIRSAARQTARRERGLPSSPRKVTLTASGRLHPAARFFAYTRPRPLVYASAAAAGGLAALLSAAEVVELPDEAALPGAKPAGAPADLDWILADLAARGIGRLLVEGGSSVLAQFLSAGLADEFRLAIAPVFVADARAPRLLASSGALPRLTLAEASQVGNMAVLRYVRAPGPAQPASDTR
ncbi:MAG: RibD family protein [Streptosporangiaceae bacterium]